MDRSVFLHATSRKTCPGCSQSTFCRSQRHQKTSKFHQKVIRSHQKLMVFHWFYSLTPINVFSCQFVLFCEKRAQAAARARFADSNLAFFQNRLRAKPTQTAARARFGRIQPRTSTSPLDAKPAQTAAMNQSSSNRQRNWVQNVPRLQPKHVL